MAKNTKPTRSFSIDQWVLDLSKDLGINRSKIAQEALIAEIGIKLGTLDLTVANLQQMATVHQLEENRRKEGIQLRVQRIEQEGYAESREKEMRQQREEKLISVYRNFCITNHLLIDRFSSAIMGDSEPWPELPIFEETLCRTLQQEGFPADLNILRPLLFRAVPVIA